MHWLGRIIRWLRGGVAFLLQTMPPVIPPPAELIKSEPPAIPPVLLELSGAFNEIWQADKDGMTMDERQAHAEESKDALLRVLDECKKHPGMRINNLDEVARQVVEFWETVNPQPEIGKVTPVPSSAIVAVLDTETTGLGAQDELISVAVLVFEVELPSGKMLREIETFYGLREPSVPIHPKAQEVHGLSLESLRGKTLDIDTLQRIVESVDVLIAHNAQFDRRMLAKLLPDIEVATWGCSMLALRNYWSNLPRKSLDSICAALDVSRAEPHNALSDCRALAEVLFKHSGTTTRSRTYMGHLALRPWAPPP